jgi:hypothetical protein
MERLKNLLKMLLRLNTQGMLRGLNFIKIIHIEEAIQIMTNIGKKGRLKLTD